MREVGGTGDVPFWKVYTPHVRPPTVPEHTHTHRTWGSLWGRPTEVCIWRPCDLTVRLSAYMVTLVIADIRPSITQYM
jgi:hypothetical protein